MEPTDTHESAEQQNQPKVVTAAEYLREALVQVRGGRHKEAYGILLQAGVIYPDHPIILSYCGWLQAVVDKKPKNGLAACRRAFILFKSPDPQAAERVYPHLYLNLGRTFLVEDRKKDAVQNFRKGLKYDRSNAELKKELKLLGIRKKPPLPFLSRSNFINIIIGKLFHSNPSRSQTTR